MPDEVRRPVPDDVGEPRPRDLLDDLSHFVEKFPAWVGPDGFPLSYRHFRYGMSYLGRQYLRDQLANAESTRVGGATEDSFLDFQREVRFTTEVPRDG